MADKSEVIEVTAFSGVNDRNGKPAWKLTANVSWSQYAIEYLEWPRMDGESAFTLGQYQAEFSKGNSFRNKQGSDRDYDYYWNPITMNYIGAGGNGGAPVAMVDNRPVLALSPTATAVEVALHQTPRKTVRWLSPMPRICAVLTR